MLSPVGSVLKCRHLHVHTAACGSLSPELPSHAMVLQAKGVRSEDPWAEARMCRTVGLRRGFLVGQFLK